MDHLELYSYIQRMNERHELLLMLEELQNESLVRKMKRYCKRHGNTLYGDSFLSCYGILKGSSFQFYFDKLLMKYKFRYSSSIRDSISYLLSPREDFDYFLEPSSFPGIYHIYRKGDFYFLNTIEGTVHVKRASDVFLDTLSFPIFSRPLSGSCYSRCYEFLKLNPEYKVVFSRMPNFFIGWHYHVYLKNKYSVIDVSSNAYYEDLSFKIPLKGKIFKIASIEEIEDLKSIFHITDNELYFLSYYYDLESKKNVKQNQKLVRK